MMRYSAVFGAALVGSGYCYWRAQNAGQLGPVQFNALQDAVELQASFAELREFMNGTGKNLKQVHPPQIDLFMYPACPWCGKVKAFLDCNRIPYREVTINPVNLDGFMDQRYKTVPVMSLQRETGERVFIADSAVIVNQLNMNLVGTTAHEDPEIVRWRDFSSDVLGKALLVSLNGSSLLTSYRRFEYVNTLDEIPKWSKRARQLIGTPGMYLIANLFTVPKMKKQGMLQDGNKAACLTNALKKWESEGLTASKPFHGGVRPDIADTDMYGVLVSALHQPDAQSLFPARTKEWADAMEAAISHSGPPR